MSFHLYINIIDKRFLSSNNWNNINKIFKQQSSIWRPGRRLVMRDGLTNDEYTIFLVYVALLYREFLINYVKKRQWEKFWIPLSPKYAKYKEYKNYYPNIWMATGTLINSISIWYDKLRDRIVIGIDEKKKYKYGNRNIPIYLVAKFLEYGTEKGLPARPLFRRARDRVSKDIKKYYNNFKNLINLIGE